MEQFLMIQNIPIRVSDSQKGEHAIVLLHGYLETLAVWEDFATALAQHYRVVCIDLPGHGLSGVKGETHTMEFMADVLAETLVKLNIPQCFVTGHSMGGYVALAFAKKYPEKTAGLCLFHSTPNADTDEKKANRDREIELIKAGKLDLIVRTNISRTFAEANIKRMDEAIQSIEENASIAEPEGVIACLRGMKEREDMNPFLKDFAKPLLFIFGASDVYIPNSLADELVVRFPQAEVIRLAQSGHEGFLEEPELSLSGLVAFADKVFV